MSPAAIETAQRRYLDLRGAEMYSSVSQPTLRRWIVTGRLPAIRPHGRYLIAIEDLERVLHERKQVSDGTSVDKNGAPASAEGRG